MRMPGVEFRPNVEKVFIPRPSIVVNGTEVPQYLVFNCGVVNDYKEFDKLCPEPKPPGIIKPGGMRDFDYNDGGFLKAREAHQKRRSDWMILQSLKATDQLVWEKVNDLDPDTWHLWKEELAAAHFSEIEIGRILRGVMVANCLDDDRIEEARKHFLATQAEGK